jgi:hypothetical protein
MFFGIGLLVFGSIPALAAQTDNHESAWEKAAEQHHAARQKECGVGIDASLSERINALYLRDQQARKFMMTFPNRHGQQRWAEPNRLPMLRRQPN